MCLLEFEEEETAIEMPCHHFFHSNCILPWLSKVLRTLPLYFYELLGESEKEEGSG